MTETRKPRVLISDKMDPNAARIFAEMGCDVDVITGETPEQLIARIGDYDGLAIRSSTRVTKEILDAATNLKVIGRAGIGVDNVDIPYASAKGVVVMNTPFGNSITTAEHAIAMIFALARQIPEANEQTQAGLWPKNGFMGVEVTGKTLGENIDEVTWNPDQKVIYDVKTPITPTGGVVGLRGTLAPDGAIVKVAGMKRLQFIWQMHGRD